MQPPIPSLRDNGPYAAWPTRMASWLLDGLLCLLSGCFVAALGLVIHRVFADVGGIIVVMSPVVTMITLIYFAWMQGEIGASPGKRLLGLRVRTLGEETGRWRLGLARLVVHLLDGLPLYLGWLLPIVDRRRQTIADKVLRTVVTTGAERQRLGGGLLVVRTDPPH